MGLPTLFSSGRDRPRVCSGDHRVLGGCLAKRPRTAAPPSLPRADAPSTTAPSPPALAFTEVGAAAGFTDDAVRPRPRRRGTPGRRRGRRRHRCRRRPRRFLRRWRSPTGSTSMRVTERSATWRPRWGSRVRRPLRLDRSGVLRHRRGRRSGPLRGGGRNEPRSALRQRRFGPVDRRGDNPRPGSPGGRPGATQPPVRRHRRRRGRRRRSRPPRSPVAIRDLQRRGAFGSG